MPRGIANKYIIYILHKTGWQQSGYSCTFILIWPFLAIKTFSLILSLAMQFSSLFFLQKKSTLNLIYIFLSLEMYFMGKRKYKLLKCNLFSKLYLVFVSYFLNVFFQSYLPFLPYVIPPLCSRLFLLSFFVSFSSLHSFGHCFPVSLLHSFINWIPVSLYYRSMFKSCLA